MPRSRVRGKKSPSCSKLMMSKRAPSVAVLCGACVIGPLCIEAVGVRSADAGTYDYNVQLASGHHLHPIYYGSENFSFFPFTVAFSYDFDDNVVGATNQTIDEAVSKGYRVVGGANGVCANVSSMKATSAAGLLPLQTFFSKQLNDTLTTASAAGFAWASNPDHGYEYVRTECSCSAEPPPVGGGAFDTFVTYWSAQRNDSFLVKTGTVHEQDAISAGYEKAWDECYSVPVPQEWKIWPDDGAAVGIPFPKSKDLLSFEYLEGANAAYGGADTWYPSWASDGNLYTPWTDGTVNGVRSGSGGKPGQGYNSTTGHATLVGDDPFSLQVENVTTVVASTFPYPCGSLYHQGTWYYGTYYVDNPNVTTPQGDFVGPNPGPNCGNWCIQGPVASFRTSLDNGQTWHEPRFNATGPADNILGESAVHNQKVKFGAPHFVDFGQELMHSPDGKAYVVGHGASRPEAIQAWMLGDEVYLARFRPEDANNGSAWEFYSGGHGTGATWSQGSVASATPLVVWNNHTGVVTMTYHPAIKKFTLAISTADHYPYMTEEFDTYFLESDSITGPWSYVNYMSKFGPEAYFVHFPSKFLASDFVTTTASPGDEEAAATGFYDAFLMYSANFAFKNGSTPVGSGYHMSLQRSRFSLSSTFVARLEAQS